VLELAHSAIVVENHYSKKAGQPTPMDVEWANDGKDGALYIIQARPETVASRRKPEALESYRLKATGKTIATGRAVGEKIAAGKVRLVRNERELGAFRPGEVLVAPATSPDWEPVMKLAAAMAMPPSSPASLACRQWSAPATSQGK
jgi:pyruvate,water dikinase